jgi:hypothetical protein
VQQRRCENKKCRSRNNRALWAVDGSARCNHCFEVFMETASLDEHRIIRLTDDPRAFPEADYKYEHRVAQA